MAELDGDNGPDRVDVGPPGGRGGTPEKEEVEGEYKGEGYVREEEGEVGLIVA